MTAKAEKMTKAIAAGDIAEVERLIAKGYPVSGKNILKQIETGGKKLSLYTTPLEYALSEKQFDIAKLLIDSGAEMPASNSPLIRAIRLGRPDLFAYMVEHGAVLEKTKGAVVQLLANLAGNWDDAYIPWIAALHLPIKRYGGDGLHCAAQENEPGTHPYCRLPRRTILRWCDTLRSGERTSPLPTDTASAPIPPPGESITMRWRNI